MGTVRLRVEDLIAGLRDTPWPDADRLVASLDEAGDDARGAWAAAERADDVLAIAAAYGVAARPALAFAASLLREASSLLGLRDARVARVAFATEQGGAKSSAARTKLLDDAKALLVDAQTKVAVVARQKVTSRAFADHATMEVFRAGGFVALGVVTAGDAAPANSNVAHAIRQVAAAFAAHRLGASDPDPIESAEEFQKCIDAAAAEELSRLGPELRLALDTDFERALGAEPV
jgi:hypothetical protein